MRVESQTLFTKAAPKTRVEKILQFPFFRIVLVFLFIGHYLLLHNNLIGDAFASSMGGMRPLFMAMDAIFSIGIIMFLYSLYTRFIEKRKAFEMSVIATALSLIIWNMNNDWAHLEFMNNAKTYKNYAVSPGEFLLGQVLFNNPATLPIWIVGILFLLFNKNAQKYRFLGWMFVSLFILLMLQHAKDYYLSGAYPIVFAAGGVQFERWLNRIRWGSIKTVFLAPVLVSAVLFAPMALPVLPVEPLSIMLKRLEFQAFRERTMN